MDEWKRRRRRTVVLLASAALWLAVIGTMSVSSRSSFASPDNALVDDWEEADSLKTWVSMSVCFDESEKEYHKKNFPYLLATELSTALWRNKTSVEVIVQVVHKSVDGKSASELQSFLARLRSLGAHAEAVQAQEELGSCVLQAQLQRVFAFRLPYVSDLDVIAMSDVDIFVLDADAVTDMTSPDGRRRFDTWLYQYETTLNKALTFGMSFVAMRKGQWRELLGDADAPATLIDKHRDYLNSHFKVWNYDQVLLSRLILEQGRCFLPDGNPLWKSLGLEPVSVDGEGDRCFKGVGQQNCNRDSAKGGARRGKCLTWHFHPYERETELRRKFEEALGVREEPPLAVRKMQEVGLELEKILGLRNR